MTAKRFTEVWCSETGHIGITDKGIDKEFTGSKFKEFLNELHEERNYFERKKCEYWNKFNLAHLDNINLRKENEQLKKQNKRLKEKIQKERNSFKKTQERYSKEAEAKIKELAKENENTKSVLDDFMWILNVLQANPNDTKRLGVARDMLQNMGVLLYDK